MLASYGNANGCTFIEDVVTWPKNKLAPKVWCRQMYKCDPGVDVVRCSWEGGHTWPNTEEHTYADFSYDFMVAHPRKVREHTKKKAAHNAWSDDFDPWMSEDPSDRALLMRMIALSIRP